MASKKSKSKQLISIMAPKVFGEIELGKTFASEPSYIIGRKINTNVMNVVSDSNKYYMKLIFLINSVDDTKALTEFIGSELLREYLSRMTLRRVKKIDMVQNLVTKDGVKVRVKSVAVISKKMSTRTKFDLGAKMKELVKQQVESSTMDDFIEKMINDEIKMRVMKEARKIYPVRYFELRKTEVIRSVNVEAKRQ